MNTFLFEILPLVFYIVLICFAAICFIGILLFIYSVSSTNKYYIKFTHDGIWAVYVGGSECFSSIFYINKDNLPSTNQQYFKYNLKPSYMYSLEHHEPNDLYNLLTEYYKIDKRLVKIVN